MGVRGCLLVSIVFYLKGACQIVTLVNSVWHYADRCGGFTKARAISVDVWQIRGINQITRNLIRINLGTFYMRTA